MLTRLLLFLPTAAMVVTGLSFGPVKAESVTQLSLSEDEVKCFNISKRVCGEGLDIKDCMYKNRSQFPSYCLEEVGDRFASVSAVAKSSEMKSCTQALMAKCKMELPEAQVKPDMNALKNAMAKYQSCMDKQMDYTDECKAMAVKEAKSDKNSGQVFQKIK